MLVKADHGGELHMSPHEIAKAYLVPITVDAFERRIALRDYSLATAWVQVIHIGVTCVTISDGFTRGVHPC